MNDIELFHALLKSHQWRNPTNSIIYDFCSSKLNLVSIVKIEGSFIHYIGEKPYEINFTKNTTVLTIDERPLELVSINWVPHHVHEMKLRENSGEVILFQSVVK